MDIEVTLRKNTLEYPKPKANSELELLRLRLMLYKSSVNLVYKTAMKLIDEIYNTEGEQKAKHLNDLLSLLDSLGIKTENNKGDK